MRMRKKVLWLLAGGVLIGAVAGDGARAAGAERRRGSRSSATVVTGDVNVVNSQVTIGGNSANSSLVIGNGRRVTRELAIAGAFTGIDLSGVSEVDVTCGKPTAVELLIDENLHPLVSASVEHGRLTVRFSKPVQTRESPRLTIAMPALDSLRLSGSDTVRVVELRGTRLLVEHEGSGNVTLVGKVGTIVCKVSGVGEVDAAGLKCDEAVVTVTGVGSVTCRPEKKLGATLSGVGGVRCLTRPPEVQRDVTGIGDVEFVGGR